MSDFSLDDPSFYEDFLVEAGEHFELIEQNFLTLEGAPGDLEILPMAEHRGFGRGMSMQSGCAGTKPSRRGCPSVNLPAGPRRHTVRCSSIHYKRFYRTI